MKILLLIVAVPLIGAGAFFAVSNRQTIEVDLWPFWDRVPMQLWLALGAAFYLGFVFGAIAAWWAGHSKRVRGAREARRAERLARDNAALEARLAQAQAAQSGQGRPLPARSA
jgi:hypothetical protein